MTKLNVTILLVVLATGCQKKSSQPASITDLYVLEIDEQGPEGNGFAMKFEELRRLEKTSTIKVTHVNGASVASSMFIVRGCYEIAKRREALYFAKIREWRADDGSWMYLVGFSNDENVEPINYFDLEDPHTEVAAIRFMSVKSYDQIFLENP